MASDQFTEFRGGEGRREEDAHWGPGRVGVGCIFEFDKNLA